jgi:uncharacterized membrane protein SpoIIM required for sporulation
VRVRFVTRDVLAPGFSRALVAALVTAIVGCVVGYASMRGVVADAVTSRGSGGGESGVTLRGILSRNIPAALLVYSGVSTLGFSTIIALLALGGFVGATFATAVATIGVRAAAGSIIAYAPVEMLGLLLAAVAGLTPITAVLSRGAHESRANSYVGSLSRSLRILCVAIFILAVAGALESLVISSRA